MARKYYRNNESKEDDKNQIFLRETEETTKVPIQGKINFDKHDK
jgi:hypothetical protein